MEVRGELDEDFGGKREEGTFPLGGRHSWGTKEWAVSRFVWCKNLTRERHEKVPEVLGIQMV